MNNSQLKEPIPKGILGPKKHLVHKNVVKLQLKVYTLIGAINHLSARTKVHGFRSTCTCLQAVLV